MAAQGNPQWSQGYPDDEAYRNDIRLHRLYVVTIEGNIAGFAAICEGDDPDYEGEMWQTAKPYMSIHRLGVHPIFRRFGVAKTLFRFAEEYARSKRIPAIRIDTFSKNRVAPQLFLSMGYTYVGDISRSRLPDPYPCFEKNISEK